MTRTLAIGLAVGTVCSLAPRAHGDVAFDNFGPNNGFTGNGWAIWGPQNTPSFTQGFRFVAGASGSVSQFTVAFYHLQGTNQYPFEIHADAANQPGPQVVSLGTLQGSTTDGIVQTQSSSGQPLVAGTTYWLVVHGLQNAMGNLRDSPTPGGVRALSFDDGVTWQVSVIDPPPGIPAFRLEVNVNPPDCYANCDGSTAAPVLNVADFTCFLQKFAAGVPYANCDGSTAPPVLNVADFTCFLQKFAAGCP